MAVVLGDDAAAFGVALDGHVVGERVAADDRGAGVHALAAHLAFDRLGGVDHGLGVGLGFVGGLQVGVGVEGLLDRDAQLAADQLADLVAHVVGVAQHARGVAHGVFGLQLAEGDHARDVVFAVELADVLDHVLAVLVVEVDVDIGHLDALFRKEAFEQKAVRKRVEVGNAHRVGDDGAGGRTTARAYADAVVLGPHDVFLHDEEVGREALLDDDVSLVLVALDDVGAQLAELFHVGAFALTVALDQAFLAFLAEPAHFGLAIGHGEFGQNGVALEHDVALFGDFEGVVAGFGEVL